MLKYLTLTLISTMVLLTFFHPMLKEPVLGCLTAITQLNFDAVVNSGLRVAI